MLAFGLSILAGLLGSIVLYAIGYIGEDLLLVKLKAKRPALGARLDRFERRLVQPPAPAAGTDRSKMICCFLFVALS